MAGALNPYRTDVPLDLDSSDEEDIYTTPPTATTPVAGRTNSSTPVPSLQITSPSTIPPEGYDTHISVAVPPQQISVRLILIQINSFNTYETKLKYFLY